MKQKTVIITALSAAALAFTAQAAVTSLPGTSYYFYEDFSGYNDVGDWQTFTVDDNDRLRATWDAHQVESGNAGSNNLTELLDFDSVTGDGNGDYGLQRNSGQSNVFFYGNGAVLSNSATVTLNEGDIISITGYFSDDRRERNYQLAISLDSTSVEDINLSGQDLESYTLSYTVQAADIGEKEITFSANTGGWGQFESLEFKVIPEPSIALLGGLGLLGLLRRRRA